MKTSIITQTALMASSLLLAGQAVAKVQPGKVPPEKTCGEITVQHYKAGSFSYATAPFTACPNEAEMCAQLISGRIANNGGSNFISTQKYSDEPTELALQACLDKLESELFE